VAGYSFPSGNISFNTDGYGSIDFSLDAYQNTDAGSILDGNYNYHEY
jgi:hypothetical protein